MSPVSRMLVDQMGDQDNLGTPEVAPSPEEDPGEDEQVVQNKMRTHVGGRRHDRGIFMEKMVNIAELGEEEKDPMTDVSQFTYFIFPQSWNIELL